MRISPNMAKICNFTTESDNKKKKIELQRNSCCDSKNMFLWVGQLNIVELRNSVISWPQGSAFILTGGVGWFQPLFLDTLYVHSRSLCLKYPDLVRTFCLSWVALQDHYSSELDILQPHLLRLSSWDEPVDRRYALYVREKEHFYILLIFYKLKLTMNVT